MRDILILKCTSEAPICHCRDPHSNKNYKTREKSGKKLGKITLEQYFDVT